jgi:hypothetical protein
MSNTLLGIVILLFLCMVMFRTQEGFMDSDVMAIQTDITQQKAVVDKQIAAFNMLLKLDPNKDPNDTFDVEPILKKVVTKLQTLDKDKKEENVALMGQLKLLRKKIEEVPPLIEKYRTEVKKFSNTKMDQTTTTVGQFLPESKKMIEGLKADIDKILKD